MNREEKEAESRSRKRQVEGERGRVEINSKRICMDRLSSPDVCGQADAKLVCEVGFL